MNDLPGPTALIVLDVQDAIDRPVWDGKSHPGYLTVIQRLLAHWRAQGWPVVHVKHDEPNPASSYHSHGPWNGIKKEVAPAGDEVVVTKRENCAFIATELDDVLKRMHVERLVITGVVIHNSMDATIRAGKALGYSIVLPADATTAVPVTSPEGRRWDAQTVYDLTLAILGTEYAQIVSSADLLPASEPEPIP